MSKVLYDTKFLQLKVTDFGTDGMWVYAHRPKVRDVVVIIPVINNKQILFLIEKRPPLTVEGIAEYSINVPAGLVGDERENETIEDAIAAELMEEAGMKADKIEIKSRRLASSPGCVTEIFTVAIAYVDEYKIIFEPIDDGGVIADRVLVDIDKIYPWLKEKEKEGCVISAQVLAGLFYLKENL